HSFVIFFSEQLAAPYSLSRLLFNPKTVYQIESRTCSSHGAPATNYRTLPLKMKQSLLSRSSNSSNNDLTPSEERRAVKRIKGSAIVLPDNLDVSTSGYAVLFRQLFRWRASIYRLIWIDLLIWLTIYYVLNIIYRFVLNPDQKLQFENTVEQVGEWSGKIPVTFLLGFFVSNVASRWWNIYTHIPRMSGPAAVLVGSIQSGSNPGDAAKYRMTIARYLNLAWVLALWNICSGLQERFEIVKKLTARFQSDFDLTEDGKIKPVPDSGDSNYDQLMRLSEQPVTDPVRRSLERLLVLNRDPLIRKQYGRIVTRSELAVFLQRSQRVNGKYEPEWFLPFYWALATAEEALEKGLIRDNRIFLKVQEEIYAWSGKIRVLINFARRGLPLVYTQVVIIAVYTVFLSDTLSRQLLDPKEAITRKAKGYYVDYLVPILGIVHMIFMVGWFKVALVLMDPFG
uniref:Bestrophin homolog n=1 Tax=Macrostomum lignano TaxID=282301 RepID=A0A1I8J2J0_9PLAT